MACFSERPLWWDHFAMSFSSTAFSGWGCPGLAGQVFWTPGQSIVSVHFRFIYQLIHINLSVSISVIYQLWLDNPMIFHESSPRKPRLALALTGIGEKWRRVKPSPKTEWSSNSMWIFNLLGGLGSWCLFFNDCGWFPYGGLDLAIFGIQVGMSPSQLMNSSFSEGWLKTTNQ